MIHLYYRQRCTSSSKAIQWFKSYGIIICIRSSGQISREELIIALSSTDKGFTDLLKHPNHLNDEEMSKIRLLKTMTLNQGIDFIKVNPQLLRSPIIIERNKVLIGYNPDQIRMFLPKVYRRKSLLRSVDDTILKYNSK
ncbi:ArsC/Spx/MgsR family protein [Lactococcus garvieae]|uniref:ArsC/Spx/MgsR family protein n=1 Tax=Lactococcus garvieae TaxID=1363 RepID=UPI00398E9FDF